MLNNFIKDASSSDVYLISDLLKGQKTTVKNCGLSPLTGVIICPETGRPVDLVELFLGKKVFLDSVKYDMTPMSGLIKSSDGEFVNLVELILGAGSGSGSGDWVVQRISIKDIIKTVNVCKGVGEQSIITVTLPNKKYFFSVDEVELFNKDEIFTLNGLAHNNDDTTKFCSVGILTNEVDATKTSFEEGNVYTLNLLDSSENYIFSQTLEREVI